MTILNVFWVLLRSVCGCFLLLARILRLRLLLLRFLGSSFLAIRIAVVELVLVIPWRLLAIACFSCLGCLVLGYIRFRCDVVLRVSDQSILVAFSLSSSVCVFGVVRKTGLLLLLCYESSSLSCFLKSFVELVLGSYLINLGFLTWTSWVKWHVKSPLLEGEPDLCYFFLYRFLHRVVFLQFTSIFGVFLCI